MIKKLLLIGMLSTLLVGFKAIAQAAGTATLSWDPYPNPSGLFIKVYGVAGSNTVFTAGNANATTITSTQASNTSLTVTNLPVGYWTFVATAATAITGGVESTNSNVAVGLIRPGAVTTLRITGTTP